MDFAKKRNKITTKSQKDVSKEKILDDIGKKFIKSKNKFYDCLSKVVRMMGRVMG